MNILCCYLGIDAAVFLCSWRYCQQFHWDHSSKW